ncbi:MFS transporter [Aliidiomarina halalkaliphila]|uniref:MFS transporter n=1 Tax=Aliidiomarina halalkaliphila TaxID=2593535 RepID=A0A552WZD6_9GAMM|nr:VC0807 family protein [Aliidiomarina halalkaliphila]TRW48056.1 MFS transporter [Aliidiomarina halalkaliphila]
MSARPEGQKQPGLLPNLMFNILLPVVILMQLSSEERLGPVWALIIGLAFPIGYGLWDLNRRKKINGFSVLGIISVLLTGGIGLLQLDPKYIAIKEAAVPAIFGLVVWGSRFTKFPIVEKLLLNRQMLDVDALYRKLAEKGNQARFKRVMNMAGNGVAAAFALSAVLNYILASAIVVSPAGTEAFNNEIGRMTALSFPVIVLPTMLVMFGAIFYLFHQINALTGDSIEAYMHDKKSAAASSSDHKDT